jgi:hypothetical protein
VVEILKPETWLTAPISRPAPRLTAPSGAVMKALLLSGALYFCIGALITEICHLLSEICLKSVLVFLKKGQNVS